MAASNRIDKLFENRDREVLSIYFTAGYPRINDTQSIITNLQKCGVDMIEIGIPFSDPIADGPTIQNSSQVALKNGMTVELLFEQLGQLKGLIDTPLILMSYLNPIYQYGMEEFCNKCYKMGIDGLIIPDLPLHDLNEKYATIFEKYGLKNILLITPQTPEERIIYLDKCSTGFNYIVSSASTTGKSKAISEEQMSYLSRIKQMDLKNPNIIGFGISDKQSFEEVCRYSDGAIIGSAFIQSLAREGSIESNIKKFVKTIRK